MKRICVIALAVALLAAMCLPAAAAGSYIRGDADGDGEVTIADVTVIQRVLVGLSVPAFNEKAADIDGKGLDITDATAIQRKLVSLIDLYGIGEVVTEPVHPTQDEYELPFVPC